MLKDKKAVILTIDDERAIRDSIRNFLEDYDYKVYEAENGLLGLDTFATVNPDLILVDLRMPEVDGLQVLATVKRESPNTPVIVVSGTGVIGDIVEALHLGAWDYILKPIMDMSVLLHAVETCLERSRLIAENRQYQRHLEDLVEKRTQELKNANEELQNANRLLSESEEKYRNIFNKANVGLFRFSINDGMAIEANDVIASMYGYEDRDDFLENFNYLGHFIKDDERADFLACLGERGEIIEYPAHQTTKNDVPCWFSFTGRIYPKEGFIEGAVLDITKRRHVEEERERLIFAINQAAECIVITDSDGQMLYINPAFETVTGYNRDEALGKNPSILKSGQQSKSFYNAMWKTLKKGDVWSGHLFNKRKDGSKYEEEVTISPVVDANGKITHYVAVMRDVTEQRKLEQQLRQAQKMEAVGQLAGGVAHDFNNLLQAISGYTNMAMINIPDDNPVRDDLQEVLKASKRATTLIRQLLIFSRQDRIHPVPVNANEIVSNVTKMLRRVIGEHIEIIVSTKENIHTINADPGQIEQVLMNLCVNARDAMVDGGNATISTNNVSLDRAFCEAHTWAKEGEYVSLSVADTGTGVPPEIRERIFEPFFTTKEAGKGTGLGLATVYGIAERHEALIDIESENGVGSTFKIYFPVVIEEASTEMIEEEKLAEPGGAETILLAEDDSLVRRLASQVLQRSGYDVIQARDGEEAIQLFDMYVDKIDMALLDVIMPKKSGRAVHDRIVEIRPEMPILFSSGYSYNILEKSSLPDKDYELIQKPYTPQDLLRHVRKILHKDTSKE